MGWGLGQAGRIKQVLEAFCAASSTPGLAEVSGDGLTKNKLAEPVC